MSTSGQRNLITDVAGLRVGNANDHKINSGVTAILCDPGATAAVQVLGGAPGTRETDLLEPHNTVQSVNGLVLSGGSAFGLDAASGAQAYLREQDIGFEVGPHRIPILPAAILFDLINGGDKDWGRYPPYRELGYQAAANASEDFAIGSQGAGLGALTATVKGGLGSASFVTPDGHVVGALVAVNPMGSAIIGDTRHFWAAPFEIGGEFGGLGMPSPMPDDSSDLRIKFRDMQRGGANTTIAVIATDAALTKAEAKRLAIAAHAGFARAIWPSHTPFDGDLVFALATGASGRKPSLDAFVDLGAAAASTMSRAIARGVQAAQPDPRDLMPAWSTLKD
ncbi:L-aminopeptidase/D-esterase [Hoeflea phototrophica DFL-43]|uniref:L-aminopeptidase/D-esterase n=1 Tax=Hoeflea phototrophica (strain DSM 17068 / NCIMB 14078 / DFL-43) TaxID=411684 RepID=A9D687_HOEPD|nr:P1 family peptidase [Hoeflea phototrophica]EDQ33444.1 L-aminopeptidase/D-esterase [Hoeflea phototrophica DFL-43]